MEELEKKRRELRRQRTRFCLSLAASTLLLTLCFGVRAYAASFTVDLGSGTAGGGGVLDVLVLFALLALLPSLLMMVTSFTRIIIVLSFLRNALGTQQSPPNQVLVAMALFLTLFIMNPVLQQINTEAYRPYRAGEIDQTTAVRLAAAPIKDFMIRQTKEKEFNLFLSLSGQQVPMDEETGEAQLDQLSLTVLVPAFMTSELKRAFTIGFYLFLPFLIIDMVVSSTLMSMGMVMLPPSMIALPFKIMMFVLVDGWDLLFDALIRGFH